MKYKRNQIYIFFICLVGVSYGGWLYWSIQEGRFQNSKESSKKTAKKSSSIAQNDSPQSPEKSKSHTNNPKQNPLNLKAPNLPQKQVNLFEKRYQSLLTIQESLDSDSPLRPKRFQQILGMTQDLFPTKSEAQELKAGQVHTTPPSLRLAGKALGEIKAAVKNQPELEAEAESFYTSCSKNQELMDTIRALCLTNKALIYRQRGEKLNMRDYPPKLRRLADEILKLEP